MCEGAKVDAIGSQTCGPVTRRGFLPPGLGSSGATLGSLFRLRGCAAQGLIVEGVRRLLEFGAHHFHWSAGCCVEVFARNAGTG